jgi:hypothetical protein
MRLLKFSQKSFKIEQLGNVWFELYKGKKLIAQFTSFEASKNYYNKECKPIKK